MAERKPLRGGLLSKRHEHPIWIIGTLILVPIACALLAHGFGVCNTVFENTHVENNAPWKRVLTNCEAERLFIDLQVIGQSPYGRQLGGILGLRDGPGVAASVNDNLPFLVFQASINGSDWVTFTYPSEPKQSVPLGPSA